MLLNQDKLGGAPITNNQLKHLPHILHTHSAIDIPCHQMAYSWKGFSHGKPIYEWLDRTISNMAFYNDFDQSTLLYGTFTVPDHAPILFSTNQTPPTKPPPFRFQIFWVLDNVSHSIVKKYWNTNIAGSRFYRIQQKLLRIKTALKSRAKTEYRHTTNKLQWNDEKLQELQNKLWQRPFDEIWVKHINTLILQREKLLLFNQKAWGNTTRKTWLTQGDRNSRYFHNKMKTITTHSTIFRLKNEVGQWVDSQQDLNNILSKSFQERFNHYH